MSSNKKQEIILHKADKLTLEFPENDNPYIQKDIKKTNQVIQDNGIYTSEGQTFIDKKDIAHMLVTDTKGANRVYNDLDDEDKLENGSKKYISVPALNKEISKRIEDPKDTNVKDRLKHNEKALITLRDTPEVEKKREQLESHIKKELPRVKAKIRKDAKIDIVTKKPLTNPEIHHIERVADNPRKALDEDNLVPLNKDTHIKVHNENADTKEGFEKFKEKYKPSEDEN